MYAYNNADAVEIAYFCVHTDSTFGGFEIGCQLVLSHNSKKARGNTVPSNNIQKGFDKAFIFLKIIFSEQRKNM